MSNTRALDTLVEMTRELLNEAGIQLANSRKSAQQALEFLETLNQYRADYSREMQRLMREGIDSMTLGNYRAFVGSLDKAISQAHVTVKEQEQAVSNHQANWQDQHLKINSYETLIERRHASERIRQSRIEQRQTDEISSQMRLRQNRHNDLSSPGF
jgi:flagellar protein FliJ